MKTKIFMGCLMAASLFTMTSCSDFLTEDPKGQLTPDNFPANKDDLTNSIHTLYEKMNQTQSWTNPMYPQWQGDDMTANPGSNKQAVAALDGFSSNGDNKGVTGAWDQHYAAIKAANLLLATAKNALTTKSGVTESDVALAEAQAHYWRAYCYFYLVRIFGPLPLITTTDVSLYDVKLSSVEEVYNLIVEDLKAAEKTLPIEYDVVPQHHDGIDSWVTKQACQATMTAVYMAMAGYPLNKGTEYYKLAADKAKEVIDNNSTYGFYVDEDWSHVYSMGHNYNKETILGIDNSPLVNWDHDSELTSCCRFEGLGDGGWGDAWGEIAFWKRYPEGPRKNVVYAPKVTFQDGYTITKAVDWWELDENGNKVVAAYHPMFATYSRNADATGKEIMEPYDYMKPNYKGMTNGHRHRVIRYSELLLWYAESAARSGGDLNKAKEYLRLIRKRAVTDYENVTLSSGATVKIADMTADQLAEACYIEHGWEVAGYWTAMVTRRADEFRMNELKKNFDYRVANKEIEVANVNGKSYKAKESVTVTKSTWDGDNSIYCPYPTLEAEKNPNLHR